MPPTAAASAAPRLNAPLLARLAPLYLAQALATGSVNVSTILAALVVGNLGFPGLIGLPATLLQASAALCAGAFGALMLSRGRALGLGLAFGLGALGAVVGFAGARAGLLPVFLLGAVMMGAAQGGYQQARYAVAESVPAEVRGAALGALMLMSVLGSFVMTGFSGPLEHLAARLGTTPEITGWLVGGGLLGVAALLMLRWRPPATALAPVASPSPAASLAPAAALAPAAQKAPVPLPWRQVLRAPEVRRAGLALATAQGLMVTLMSLTPHRAHEMGLSHASVAALISGHILGMFGFGWLTGPLIDRVGVRTGYVAGALLLLAAALSAPLPGQTWLAVSMFVLGLGWSLAFVSGTKALSSHPAAQGLVDSLGYVAAGVGTLLGGVVIARAGFPVLAHICAALALLPLWSAWDEGRARPGAPGPRPL